MATKKKIAIPGTDAFVEVDEAALDAIEAAASAPSAANDFQDLHPHSGENFGKPALSGQ